MANSPSNVERRACPRITSEHGTATLLTENGVIMGWLVNISFRGICLTYQTNQDLDLSGSDLRVNILTQQPDLYLEKIPSQVIFDQISEKEASSNAGLKKRCGIEFYSLTPYQQSQLTYLIEFRTKQQAEREKYLEKELIKNEEKYRTILESITEGYFEVDIAGNITFFNSSLLKAIDYTSSELMGLNYRQFMSPETAQRVFREYNKAYRTGILPTPFDWQLVKKNGSTIHVETSLSFIKNGGDNIVGFRGIARDISTRKKFEQELLYMASHDQLTGLYNRGALFERLREIIAFSKRFNKKCALLFMDLDNFKQVNDRFGHQAGDRVLKETADRLSGLLRETDYISRHGGDEFTIILNDPENVDPIEVAQKIIETIAVPYDIGRQEIAVISTSIGISIYPDDGVDVDALIGRADKAMYRAKGKKNCYICYNQGTFSEKLPG